jgi:phosphatidylinositol glycan class S
LGLAHCFERGEDGGKLQDVFVIEPVSANSLECMVAGADTCFKAVAGVTLGDAMARDKSKLPEEFAEAAFCDDYDFRCDATARTWLRPHAQDNLLDIVPLGASRSNFNYSVDQKRVLNMENVVNDADNIKQDMSIDVYGRKEEDDAPQEEAASSSNGAPQQQTSAKEDDDDDGLDDLFAE